MEMRRRIRKWDSNTVKKYLNNGEYKNVKIESNRFCRRRNKKEKKNGCELFVFQFKT